MTNAITVPELFELVEYAEDRVDALEDTVSAEDLERRRTVVQGCRRIAQLYKGLYPSLAVPEPVFAAVLTATEYVTGTERTDRLAAAYAVADSARAIEKLLPSLANAEAIFDSDMTDDEVRELKRVVREAQRTLEL